MCGFDDGDVAAADDDSDDDDDDKENGATDDNVDVLTQWGGKRDRFTVSLAVTIQLEIKQTVCLAATVPSPIHNATSALKCNATRQRATATLPLRGFDKYFNYYWYYFKNGICDVVKILKLKVILTWYS